ncbi:Beta sliding clamp [Buchnera aphidicola (Eriosoma grossulariae)]|uniref:DNA polymerase III subunit beta n=1 Tax=Buchnera aphidicola TaxID=9 RepID=UPI0034648987
MKFTIEQKILLESVQKISILLGKNIDFPIINNILINVTKGFLFLISTNLEIEIIAKIILSTPYVIGTITIPGRKFLNICRSLPPQSIIQVYLKNDKIILKSNKIFFSLSTLNSKNFPKFPKFINSIQTSFILQEKFLKYMIASTYFCMAKQDIRSYLNGMLFEIKKNNIRSVTTDGYRLAICNISFQNFISEFSIIISRIGVVELIKILNYSKDMLKIFITKQSISIQKKDLIFTTKLIDEKFPNYSNILLSNKKKIIEINTKLLRSSILRVAILCNEQFRGISFIISDNQLKITSNNQIDELAEEIINLHYQNNFEKIEFSFNVNYILDVLNIIQGDNVRFILNIPISSIQIEDTIKTFSKYIIMPIRM